MPSTDHSDVKEDNEALKVMRTLTTAVLRAAKAWGERYSHETAWREISRMHGVFVSQLLPGEGPATPTDLIEGLRRPLREWVPLNWAQLPDEFGTFAVLDALDCLTPEAIEYGSDYTEALFDNHSGPQRIVPSWAHQVMEQAERSVYLMLTSAGQEDYSATRRFLIEVPAGTPDHLIQEMTTRRAARTGAFQPLANDQRVQIAESTWYVPCPVCKWPMRVRGQYVQCDYPPHLAKFRIHIPKGPKDTPIVGGDAAVEVLRAEGVECVHPAVWRYITVPGQPEVDLMRWAESVDSVELKETWPGKDSWDMTLTAAGKDFRIDVKDSKHPSNIARRPPRVPFVVIPDFRDGQLAQLSRALPRDKYTVLTVSQLKAHIANKVKDAS